MKTFGLMCAAVILLGAVCSANADQQLLLQDDFQSPAVGQPVDPALWTQNSTTPVTVAGTDGGQKYATFISGVNGIFGNLTGSYTSMKIDADIDLDQNANVAVAIWADKNTPLIGLYPQQYAGDGLDYVDVAGKSWERVGAGLDHIAGFVHYEFDITVTDVTNGLGTFDVYRNGTALKTGGTFTMSSHAFPGTFILYGSGSIDNVSVYGQSVPEPMTLSLLGLGGLLLRRRK